jgi:pimeloyl-ACP methyl ester carboxylesterase
MQDRHQLLRQSDGGQLAFEEFGDPTGTPVFFFHGWPSSRTMARLAEEAARELRVRIISPDRPGICFSSLQPNRKLTDWPPLLRQLADHLAIDRFHILGVSGGAPYAYVSGWALKSRVRALAVVSGAPPIVDLSDRSGLLPFYRWMMWWNRRFPRLTRALFWAARPLVSLRGCVRLGQKFLTRVPPPDVEALRNNAAFEILFESQRDAWRSSAGVIADAEIFARPWGFRLEDVDLPVRMCHGKEDRAFSYRIAEDVARRLPNCQLHLIDDAGHYSLPIRHMREILEDLIAV